MSLRGRRWPLALPCLAALATAILVGGCEPAGTDHTAMPVATGPGPAASAPPGSATPSPVRTPGAGSVALAAIRAKGTRPTLADLLRHTPRFGPPPAPRRVGLAAAPGTLPWIKRVPTTQPVVFVTVDDGYTKDPAVLSIIRAANVKLTAFLTVWAVSDQIGHYHALHDLGATIESHAITHRRLDGAPVTFQREQLCGSADWLGREFGRRPTLLRPPYGLKDEATLRIARECGYRVGVHWTLGADGWISGPGTHPLHPGDIILLHFRETLAESLVHVLISIKEAGLTPALLADYVG